MHTDFTDILEANLAYASDFTLGELAAPAAKGLGVLTCIDSRIEPLAMLGLAPGDAKILRNAGARATNDALRSLVLAATLLEVRRIMVIAHTDCAVAHTTDDELKMRITQLHPAADEAELEQLQLHAAPDPNAALWLDVERIRACGLLPHGVIVGGFEYDVTTGLLRQVVE